MAENFLKSLSPNLRLLLVIIFGILVAWFFNLLAGILAIAIGLWMFREEKQGKAVTTERYQTGMNQVFIELGGAWLFIIGLGITIVSFLELIFTTGPEPPFILLFAALVLGLVLIGAGVYILLRGRSWAEKLTTRLQENDKKAPRKGVIIGLSVIIILAIIVLIYFLVLKPPGL